MLNRRILNAAAGVVLAAGAAAAAVWIIPEQAAPGDEGEIAPALLPILAAVVIAVFALVQVITTLLNKTSDDPQGFDYKSAVFTIAASVGLAITITMLFWAGFRIGGIIAIAVIGFAMRPTPTVAVWLVVVATALPLATYALAWHGLRLSLP